MKTYNEYLNEIEKLSKEYKKEKEMPDLPIEDRREWIKPENEEKRKKYHEEVAKICKYNEEIKLHNTKIKLKIAILRCNAKITLTNEIFPEVYKILYKYNGKPIGEKREKTIKDELKEKFSITYYIKQWCSNDEIIIYELTKEGWRKINGFEITVRTKQNQKLFKENKLNLPPIEEFIQLNSSCKYTENVDELADKIIEKYKELKEIKTKFEKLKEEYNDLTVENISNIYELGNIRDLPEVKYSN